MSGLVDKTNIILTGIGEDVGTSLVATCLAFCLAEQGIRTGFCQLAEPAAKADRLYYYIFMDREKEVESFYRAIREGRSIKRMGNLAAGVRWAVRLPTDRDINLSESEQLSLLGALSAQAVVCDLEFNDKSKGIFNQADVIVAVIDPLPCKIMANMDKINFLKKLELNGYRVVWLVNKMNKGVHLSELRQALRVSKFETFPMIDAKIVYDYQYRSLPIYKEKSVKEQVKKLCKNIIFC